MIRITLDSALKNMPCMELQKMEKFFEKPPRICLKREGDYFIYNSFTKKKSFFSDTSANRTKIKK